MSDRAVEYLIEDRFGMTAEEELRYLNALGRDGWVLTAVVPLGRKTRFYFARER